MIEVTLSNDKKMFITPRLIIAFYDVSDVAKEGVNTCIYLSNHEKPFYVKDDYQAVKRMILGEMEL